MTRLRRFYLDLSGYRSDDDHPVAGDLLMGPVAVYRIAEARPTETRLDVNRWTLTVERIGNASAPTMVMVGARIWRYTPT